MMLRALDPQTDIDLFREAYGWRSARPSPLRPDRMSFEDFSADNPRQVVVGLFHGKLQAVYLIQETAPAIYDTHFTSNRTAPKENVLAGARLLLTWLLENGAEEVVAYVSERNKPLGRFVEAVGFTPVGVSEYPCAGHSDTVDSPVMVKFIRYAAKR